MFNWKKEPETFETVVTSMNNCIGNEVSGLIESQGTALGVFHKMISDLQNLNERLLDRYERLSDMSESIEIQMQEIAKTVDENEGIISGIEEVLGK